MPRRPTSHVAIGAAVAAAVLAVLAPSAGAEPVPGVLDRPGATQGAFVSLDAHNGTDELQAYRDVEQRWGRRAELVRVFTAWAQPELFTPAQTTLAQEGRTLLVSWGSWSKGTGTPWSEVASGAHDALIDQRAAQVKALGQPVLFTFQHEPENWVTDPARTAGTAEDYCGAYRRVVDRFRAAEVTNARYGTIMMAWSSTKGKADAFYCGDAHVEWLAADGYNWYGCVSPDGPWRMPREVFEPWYAWAASKGKPLVIAEWGTGEDAAVPGRKGEWIDALNTYVKARPAIKGVLIYSTAKNRNCPRWSDTSTSSQAAFVRMGADPYYRGGEAGAPPSAPRTVRGTAGTAGGPVTARAAWAAPASTGSAPVSAYRVTALRVSSTGAVLGRTTVELPGSARTADVTLPQVGDYRFTVAAVNAAGVGTASARSALVAGR